MSNYGPPGGPNHGHPQEPWSGGPAQDPYETPSDPWGDAEQSQGQGQVQQGDQQHWSPGQEQWSAGPEPWSTGQDQRTQGYQHSTAGYPDPTQGYQDPAQGYQNPQGHPVSPHGYQPPVPGYPPSPPQGYQTPAQDYHHSYPSTGPDQGWQPANPAGPGGKGNRTGIIVVLVILGVLVLGSGGFAIHLLGREKPDQTTLAGTQPTAGVSTEPSYGEPENPPRTPDIEPGRTTPEPQPSSDARFVTAGQCVMNEGDDDAPKLTVTACGSGTYQVLERFNGQTTGKEDAEEKCSKVEGYTDWYFFDSPLDTLDYVLCLKAR